MNNKELNNRDYMIESLLKLLEEKNPLFTKEELTKYREEMSTQYDQLLMVNLMDALSEKEAEEFENLLINEPFDKEKHNTFLRDHISNAEERVLEFTKEYVKVYSKIILDM